MSKPQDIKEMFKSSLNSSITSGTLQFPIAYCSKIQIYAAAVEWSNEDKNLIYVCVRDGGDNFISLDFRYDESALKVKPKSILYDFLKPIFKDKLGDDYIQSWSIGREAIVVK